jgi:hypothetical protein
MKKYPKPAQANDSLKETPLADPLEFPIAPDFVSHPPRIDPQVMLRRIEENMRWRNKRPGEKKRRLAEKIPVEFVL